MCICCRIDVDVLLILPSTMHINVLYFVLFSFFPVEKRIFVFLHPFNICPIEKKTAQKEETWKNLVVVMNQRSTSTPFATSKWGFRSSYFPCLYPSLCKHLSGYICILFRVCVSPFKGKISLFRLQRMRFVMR